MPPWDAVAQNLNPLNCGVTLNRFNALWTVRSDEDTVVKRREESCFCSVWKPSKPLAIACDYCQIKKKKTCKLTLDETDRG